MKNTAYLFLFLIAAAGLLSSCGSARSNISANAEDYESFYQRFHQDSLFQIKRLLHPMDGYSIEGGSITPWSMDKWIMHKNGLADIDTSIYQTERVRRLGQVRERIYQPNTGVLIERHFKLIDRRWFLSFYLYVFL